MDDKSQTWVFLYIWWCLTGTNYGSECHLGFLTANVATNT